VKFKYDETPEYMGNISILNNLGICVKTISSEELKHNNSIQINLSELESGMYFIKTTINQLNYDYKIIKQ
jgi:hypothetical protein